MVEERKDASLERMRDEIDQEMQQKILGLQVRIFSTSQDDNGCNKHHEQCDMT